MLITVMVEKSAHMPLHTVRTACDPENRLWKLRAMMAVFPMTMLTKASKSKIEAVLGLRIMLYRIAMVQRAVVAQATERLSATRS